MTDSTAKQIIELYSQTAAPAVLFDKNLEYIWSNSHAETKYPFLKTHSGISALLSEEDKNDILKNIEKCFLDTSSDPINKIWTQAYNAIGKLISNIHLNYTIFKSEENNPLILFVISESPEKLNDLKIEKIFSSASYYIREPLFYIFSAIDGLNILYTKEKEKGTINLGLLNAYVDSISNNAYNMLRLVTNINNYLKLATFQNKPDNNKKLIYIDQYIDSICHDIHLVIPDSNIPFYYKITKENILMNINSDAISNAIMQILHNSFTYTKENNKISLTLSRVDNFVVITVTDEGIGIDKDKLENIFTPFSNASKPMTEFGGIGLGLPICKLIISKEGGSIDIKSSLKSGTKVTIKLPIEPGLVIDTITLNQEGINSKTLISNKFSSLYIGLAGVAKKPEGG